MVEQLIDNDMSELLDTMRLGYLRNKCIRNRVTSVRQFADLTQEGVEKVGVLSSHRRVLCPRCVMI